jgi:hypothetical protein
LQPGGEYGGYPQTEKADADDATSARAIAAMMDFMVVLLLLSDRVAVGWLVRLLELPDHRRLPVAPPTHR